MKAPEGWYVLKPGEAVKVGDCWWNDTEWVPVPDEITARAEVQIWETIIRKKDGAS